MAPSSPFAGRRLVATLHWTLERLLEAAGIALLLTLTAVIVGGVAARTLGQSLAWYDELASVLLAWLTFYGAALAALKRHHMGFAGLVLALPALWRKVAFVAAELVVVGFFLVVAWTGTKVLPILAWDTMVSLPITMDVVQSAIPVGAALFIAAEVLSLPEAWGRITAGVDPETEVIHDAIDHARRELTPREETLR
ncbi:MAG: TRAP transporter small permease [Candidatus Competibacterales bacterium]